MQRYTLFAAIAICAATAVTAQPQQKLNIDGAIVFLKGAELTSSATLALAKGENEILFTNVAGDVNSQSINVGATNGVIVEAATFQNNYLATEVLSPRAKDIKDSIELINDSRAAINAKLTVVKEQIDVLWENKKIAGANTGLSVAEMTKLLDLMGVRLEGYLLQKNKEEALLKKTDERLARLNQQLDEEQKRGYQPGGQLLVKFYAKTATTSAITISYVVPHAGWSPTYDVMATDANSPIKLYYKANIHQNSGVKWNNVRLSLSTGNPQEGAQAPILNPWYLSFMQPRVYTNSRMLSKSEVAAMPTTEVTDMVSSSPGIYQKRGGAEPATINDYVAVDNSGVNTSFDIDLPYTIPSDGQQHLVAIKEYDVPATYRYFVVPKIDKDAFLQAQITNWESLDLLPGNSNIFYEGAYVGQGYMDVNNVQDTMTISLGRDKKIVVKRDQDTKRRSVKTIGTNIRETFAYTISIRNTRKERINLIVQDQQPVSNDKDIVLEDKNTGGALYDETTGLMNWNISLAPNEAKALQFGYTYKYPKGKTIAGL